MRIETIAVAAAGFAFSSITVEIVGVPLNVLIACGIGSFCSILAHDKLKKGRLIPMFVLGVVMGAAFTGLAQWLVTTFIGKVITSSMLASMGIIVSFLTPFVLPSLIASARSGSWLAYIPFINRKKGDDQ